MDPPEHNRYRSLISKAFTPRQIGTLENEIQRIAEEHLDALVGRTSFDVVGEFTARLPMDVISWLLGIPASDRRWVQEQSNLMLHRDAGSPLPSPAAFAAQSQVNEYIHSQMNERRTQPRDDLMTRLVQVEVEGEGGRKQALSDHDIRMFVTLLATAGNETVTKLLAGIYLLLACNPAHACRSEDTWRSVSRARHVQDR
jgi:cytochrome P450